MGVLNSSTKVCKSILLFFVVFMAGCYQQPSAENLQYDADAVEEIRNQVKAMDWE
jgi:hypothetical protein